MLEFAFPWALLSLPLPYLVYRWWPASERKEAALYAPFYQRWRSLQRDQKSATRHLSNAFSLNFSKLAAITAWLCLVVACMRPQWIGDAVEIPTSGRDIMIAVDISGSMKMEDIELEGETASRLDVVKSVLSQFIQRRQGDRIGLILFGTQAYLQAPLTFDRNTVAQLLRESQIGFAGQKTAIGDAIGLAVKRLQQRPENSRLLILLTDAANTAGEITPEKAAELAGASQIKIHTIGVGASEMTTPGLLGSSFGARRFNPSRDLDETMLTTIANTTGGQYFRAHDTKELQQIYALLDQMEPVDQEAETFSPKKSLYPWPLSLALLFGLMIVLTRAVQLRPQTAKVSSKGSELNA